MALIRPNMVENAAAAATLSLYMPAGQSCRVKGIRGWRSTKVAEDLRVFIDRKLVLQIVNPIDWLIAQSTDDAPFEILEDLLVRENLWPILPVGEGQTLEITQGNSDNWDYLEVLYDLYDGPDVHRDEPNGTEAAVYRLMQVISNSGTIAAAGNLALDQSDLDAVFPGFPGGESVPSKTTMNLLALYGGPAACDDGAAGVGQATEYLRFVSGREDMFDKDLVGIIFAGDVTEATTTVYTTDAGRLRVPDGSAPGQIIKFTPPIVFPAGEELVIRASILHTAAGFIAGEVKLGMIFDVEHTP